MAKTNQELQAMTKAELEDYADTLGLDLKPHNTKDEMISAIETAQRTAAPVPFTAATAADTPAKKYAQQRTVRICGQCKYYLEGQPDVTNGTCQRYPPVLVPGVSPITAMWPPVKSLSWCGEFAA